MQFMCKLPSLILNKPSHYMRRSVKGAHLNSMLIRFVCLHLYVCVFMCVYVSEYACAHKCV